MKVSIYGRVSKGEQDYENQILQLREFCKTKEWDIYEEYCEKITGKESQRPEFMRMMEDASKRKFELILVWALDRFTREGTERVWFYMNKLKMFDVGFYSYSEPYFNTENEFVRDILLSVMGALAKQERIRISERTKAGLERAKRQGKLGGRPKLPQNKKSLVVEALIKNKPYSMIRDELNVSLGTISRIAKSFQKGYEKSIGENEQNKAIHKTGVFGT